VVTNRNTIDHSGGREGTMALDAVEMEEEGEFDENDVYDL